MIAELISSINPDTFILTFVAMLIIGVMSFWHVSKRHQFNLQNVFVDQGGKFSLNKLGQFVAMLTSTYVLLYTTRHGEVQDWLFTTYMFAWAGANLTSKFLDQRADHLRKTAEKETLNKSAKDNA